MGIVIFMFIGMLWKKLEFGMAPIIAMVLLVLTGSATISEAFYGFTNQYVVMTACILILNNAFGKTSLVSKLQHWITTISKGKGGTFLYLLLLVVALVLPMLPGSGFMILFVLILNLPKNDGISSSQILLPIGLLNSIAGMKMPTAGSIMMVGMLSGFLQGAGEITYLDYLIPGLISVAVITVYSMFAYRVLPKHEVGAAESVGDDEADHRGSLSKGKEILTYIAMIVSVVGFALSDSLGDIAFMLPAAAALILVLSNVITFKEASSVLSSKIVLMMAAIFGVVNVMGLRGVNTLFGSWIQNLLGSNPSSWMILIAFTLAAFIILNLTGASFSTLTILAPMAVAYCMQVGYDPSAVVVCMFHGMTALLLPTDTNISLLIANGKYRLVDVWKYTVPLAVLMLTSLIISCGLLMPM